MYSVKQFIMSASATEAAGSSAGRQQLEDLISIGADVELQFDDGTLMANSVVLSLFSSVLRGAVEANAGAASSSGESGSGQSSSSKQGSIPLNGITKGDWLEVAALWYPVSPSRKLPRAGAIEVWTQAEKALKIGSQFDIKLVLEKADEWLAHAAYCLSPKRQQPSYVWKWLRLADGAGLKTAVGAVARQAVCMDRAGCARDEDMEGLSSYHCQTHHQRAGGGWPQRTLLQLPLQRLLHPYQALVLPCAEFPVHPTVQALLVGRAHQVP